MMTDGQADYPEDIINEILNDRELIEKIEFHAVGYGRSSFETLERMANNFPNG